MARFVRDHPYVTAGIIGIRLAFGGIGPAAMLALRGVGALSGGLTTLIARGGTVGAMGGLMMAGIAVAVLAIGNELIPAARNWGTELAGINSSWSQMRSEIGATHADTLNSIPVVGRLLATFYELTRAIITLYNVRDEREGRRGTVESEVTTASGRYRVQQRAQQMAGQRRFEGVSQESIRRHAARAERVESIMRTAALMYHQEIRGRDLVNRHLRQAGMSGRELAATTAEIVRIQTRHGNRLEEEAEGLVSARGPFGIMGRDMRNAVYQSATQLNQLSGILRTINATTAGPSQSTVLHQGTSNPFDFAEDAYVSRGGFMGVSSGDLIVSRRHLADAVTARRGALAGPAVGEASTGQMAGPAPSTSGGGGEIAVTVPVTIDGREVARAVGRANIRQLERGGGDIAPGERRSLRETGFRRNV